MVVERIRRESIKALSVSSMELSEGPLNKIQL
jgi:hypothetical protein